METIAALICAIPTIWEIWNDRNGETAKDKIRDVLITSILYAIIMIALWWVNETHPLKSLALMLGIRVAFFDYAIQYVLIKRGVIHGHWFTYSGKTSWFDRKVSKVNSWLRLAVRVILFAAAVTAFS